MEEKVTIISIHPESGVLVNVLEFTIEDEEFLEDEIGFDSFSDYVEYYVNEEINEMEQRGYTSITAGQDEVNDIIESLNRV